MDTSSAESTELNWSTALLIGVLSGAILTLQLYSSFIFGILFQYDLRYLNNALALLGLGVGAILSGVLELTFPIVRKHAEKWILTTFSLLLPSLFIAATFTPIDSPEHDVWAMALLLVTFLAFICGGALLTSVFADNRHAIPVLFASEMIGGVGLAAMGYGATHLLGMTGTFLALAALSVAILLLSLKRYASSPYLPSGSAALLISISIYFVVAHSTSIPCNRLPASQHTQTASNTFSQIDMYTTEVSDRFTEFTLIINCSVGTQGYWTPTVESLREPLLAFRSIPFLISGARNSLILGSGAGVDVERALLASHSDITAVEINPLVVELSRNNVSTTSGLPYDVPGVHVVVAEARSFLSQHDKDYDLIVIAQAKNYGNPWGSHFFIPKNLYTKEAFRLYTDSLSETGILAIHDLDWLTDQYSHTLEASTADSPFPFSSRALTVTQHTPRPSSWILYKNIPFTEVERNAIQKITEQFRATVSQSSSIPSENSMVQTDDNPFLLQPVESKLPNSEYRYPYFLLPTTDSLPLIAHIAGYLSLSVGLLYLLYVFLTRHIRQRPHVAGIFVGIAIGSAAIQFVLINAATSILGNPVFAHAYVLSILLICGGIGGYLVKKYSSEYLFRASIVLVCGVAILIYISLPYLIEYTYETSFYQRLLYTFILVGIPSIVSGYIFVSAIQVCVSTSRVLFFWMWGFESFVFVSASIVISLAVIVYGIKSMALIALSAYAFSFVLAILSSSSKQ